MDRIAKSKETTKPKESKASQKGFTRAGPSVGKLCSNAPSEQLPGPVAMGIVFPSAPTSARTVHEPVEEEAKVKEDRSKNKEVVDE